MSTLRLELLPGRNTFRALAIVPFVRPQNSETFEDLVRERLAIIDGIECGTIPALAGLAAAVKFLQAVYQLAMLALEHLDVSVADDTIHLALFPIGIYIYREGMKKSA